MGKSYETRGGSTIKNVIEVAEYVRALYVKLLLYGMVP